MSKRPPLLVAGLMLGSTLATAAAPPAATPTPLTAEARASNVESFDYVWTTIRDRHWDPDLNGADWDAARAELRPQVEQAETREEARALFDDLLGRLDQTHFAVMAPGHERAAQEPGAQGPIDGDAGFAASIVEGRAVVTDVRDGTPAAEAGVRPGWVVTSIDGASVDARLTELAVRYAGKSYRWLDQENSVTERLWGAVGATVAIEFLDERDRAVALTLPRAEREGHAAQMGHFPAGFVTYDASRIDDRFGYIALSAFAAPSYVMSRLAESMGDLLDADGIILDLRGNHGGLGPMALGCAGWFIDESGQRLGTMYTRGHAMDMAVHPRAETYPGPLAVLIDGASASTAEILAGGLQAAGRARVFGTTSAGAALPAMIERLPNGDVFQFAIANYVSADGHVLEGRGVVPDVEIAPTRASVLAGDDMALEAALEWLRSQAPRHQGG